MNVYFVVASFEPVGGPGNDFAHHSHRTGHVLGTEPAAHVTPWSTLIMPPTPAITSLRSGSSPHRPWWIILVIFMAGIALHTLSNLFF